MGIPDGGNRPVKVNVNLVLVPVTITDGMNRLVRAWAETAFRYWKRKKSRKSAIFPAKISEVTGETSFAIDDPNDLRDAARSIGMMLRNQYLLGYRPAATRKDGKWHKIKIVFKRSKQLKLPGAFRVYARSGYYAAAE